MELIKVEDIDGKKLVSARELYNFLGHDKSQWARWSKKNIVEDEFFDEGVDYIKLDIMSNGNRTSDYVIEIDMAKELSMLARNEKGKVARKYFIEVEKKYNKPMTRLEIAKEQVRLIEELDRVEEEKNRIEIQLDINKDWYSVKRVMIEHGLPISWRPLKKYSIENGYDIRKIFDANYGEVNSYHKDVYEEVYGIDFDIVLIESN